jgi:hypothetical protein
MQHTTTKLLIAFCVYFISLNTHSSLIINGSFEDTQVRRGGWSWFNASQVNGWMGSNIEIWNNFNGLVAADGSQHIELNSHGYNGGPFSIYQDFSTIVNRSYNLTFHYRARRNDKESFKVELLSSSNDIFSSLILDNHNTDAWTLYTESFKAISDQVRLRFTSVTPSRSTIGNFIDNVSVSPQQLPAIAQVPEPNMLYLVIFAILGMTLTSKRNKQ